jgi:methionine-gamma-lyase
MKPESLMMSHGYNASWSENAIKPPVFLTSTFAFNTAEEGKHFFALAYGLKEPENGEKEGLIYSRINHPNAQIAEERLCVWDKTDEAALFSSGMAAMSSMFMAFLKPGDSMLYSVPLYGGSTAFIQYILVNFGIKVVPFHYTLSQSDIHALVEAEGIADSLKMIYTESPANPTNMVIDIEACSDIAKHYSTADKKVRLAMDNTYMGPVWQNPKEFGVDLILYSATKFIGGHSDLVAGACLGSAEDMLQVKKMRSLFGGMIDPNTAWMITRSLETLSIRCNKQEENAIEVANFLDKHPKIEKVMFPGLPENEQQRALIAKQCKGVGAMISFNVLGGEAEAFKFLNATKLIKLAVSLGSTESLAQHPFSMTHSVVPAEEKLASGIGENLIRISVGVEDAQDLIDDIAQALDVIGS